MICPHCHGTIREEQRYLMSADPGQPGLGGLLRGEGSDRLLSLVAWAFALIVVFAVAVLVFWALGLALSA